MTQDYPVPAASRSAELIIKKSRFIARAAPADSREAALAVLQRARGDYPDARHHCFAYVLGKPGAATNAAMGDDGEPSGTAGRPILNVIEHKGIGDLMVVVVRYFGGIKLGAGGLVRAYAGATEKVLSGLPLVQYEAVEYVELRFGFSQEQPVRHWAAQHGASIENIRYGEEVSLTLALPAAALGSLKDFAGAGGLYWQQK